MGDGEWSLLLAVVLGAAAVMLWGPFARRSHVRLPSLRRIPFELCFFALACVALLGLGLHVLAAVFGAGVLINAALLSTFGDWRE